MINIEFQAKKWRGKGGIRAVLKNTTIRRMEELKTEPSQ
jgi:hypothetical protein